MTQANQDRAVMEALAAPIPGDQIKQREGPGGRILSYIDTNVMMSRLDSAAGPESWEAEIRMAPDHVLCRLSVTLPSGRRVSRDGIGGYPDNNGPRKLSPEDLPKAAASDALKRAGVLFGIGRQLYEDAQDHGHHNGPGAGYSQPRQQSQSRPRHDPPSHQSDGDHRASWGKHGPPRTGKHLWGFSSENNLVDRVNQVGNSLGLRGKMIAWADDDVARVLDLLIEDGTCPPRPGQSGGSRRTAQPPASAPQSGYGNQEEDSDIPF